MPEEVVRNCSWLGPGTITAVFYFKVSEVVPGLE